MDVVRYGVRAVNPFTTPATAGITASITSGQTTATLSSASTFQNGDGVVIYGAGATNTMATPGAPTATPSLAKGAVGTSGLVNATAASTTYNYQIVARDKLGGLTAAGTVGSTSTGLATLGAQTVSISSSSRLNNIVTATTSAAHGIVAGAAVYVQGSTDSTFSGIYIVSTVPDSTHFTYTQGWDTRGGASTSSTGGTATWYQCNHLSWSAVTGAWEYYIYGRTGGSLTLIGVSKPLETVFDDYGSPVMDNQLFPDYVPTTPPGTATNDELVTTIVSGAGTTSLALANAAANTVSAATIKFDNAPNILAAATAAGSAPLYFPSTSSSLSYVVNSYLALPSTLTIWQAGGLYLNETLQVGAGNGTGGTTWFGDLGGSASTIPQFAWAQARSVAANTANPGVYVTGNGNNLFRGLAFSAGAPNGGLAFLYEGGGGAFQANFEYCSFVTGSNAHDYVGIGSEFRGGSVYHFNKVMWSSSNGGGNGLWAPGLYFRGDLGLTVGLGVTTLRNVFFVHKGIVRDWYSAAPLGGEGVTIDFSYSQGIATPTLTVQGTVNLGGGWNIHDTVTDTGAMPYLDLLNVTPLTAYANLMSVSASSFEAGGPAPTVSGSPLGNLFVAGAPGFPSPRANLGQNTNFTNGAFSPNISIQTNISGSAGYALGRPAAPTVTVGASGSCSSGCVAAGTYQYAIVANDIYGNNSQVSSCTSGTMDGTQTITISWVPEDGQVTTQRYRSPAGGTCAQTISEDGLGTGISGSSYVDSSSQFYTVSQPTAFPGNAASVGSQGVFAKQWVIPGGGFKATMAPIAGSFAANRSLTLPDATGFVPVTSYVNSAYDNATRANGAIGSNWTVQQNGLNISSNQIQGTSAGASNTAFWNANPFSTVQFSQVTVTALNGTTDFPGVTVLASGTGSSSTYYDCVENSTTIFIQRVVNTGTTNLTSTASTGAVGDILRLEITPAGALTCYKNGAVALTATDTQITSGSPGLLISGSVATEKNWSGGNLHPLAQLDTEQDWTKTQHFAQGIALGGVASESFNNNPRAEQNVFLPGALTSTWTGATWTTDKAVTITRMQVQAKTAPVGCTTSAVVRLTDGTTPVNVTISAAANDSGAISQNYAAGSSLQVLAQTAAAGCTTSPADANVTVQYRMQ